MEYAEYKKMYEAEGALWWYLGLRAVLFTMLRLPRTHRPHARQLKILDAGCGTGGNLEALVSAGYTPEGFDFSPVAVEFCHDRGLDKVGIGSITDIPYPDRSFDIVISCDVLNDAGTADEDAALVEMYRVLRPGGRLFLSLPAFTFLRGEHDQATDVARRYTKSQMRRKLTRAGLEPVSLSYWNMFLFPLVLLVRLLRPASRRKRNLRSDISLPPGPINAIFTGLLRLEARLIKRTDLPFGSSLAVVARRPAHDYGASEAGRS